jgi:hypothetical protein
MRESDYITFSADILTFQRVLIIISRGQRIYKKRNQKLLDHPPVRLIHNPSRIAADVPVFPSLDGQLQLSLVQRETSIGAADNHLYYTNGYS